MSKFKKLTGTHYRKESDSRVLRVYRHGDIIEEHEEVLRKHDPTLKTWELVGETEVNEEGEKVPKISRSVKGVTMIKRGDSKGIDIVNPKSGKVLNDKPLSEKEAEDMVEDAT